MSKTTLQAVFLAVVTAIAVAGGAYLWRAGDTLSKGDGQGKVRTSGKALIGGPFKLVDQTGTTRTEKDIQGKYSVISFGFTHCPDVCPATLQTITEALEAMGADANKIRPVFITVDPERDTVKRLKTYHDGFDPRFLMLTGSVTDIAKVAKAYKVGYRKMKPMADGGYMVNHSALIYVMGPKGEYITHYPYKIAPAKLAEGLKKWVSKGS